MLKLPVFKVWLRHSAPEQNILKHKEQIITDFNIKMERMTNFWVVWVAIVQQWVAEVVTKSLEVDRAKMLTFQLTPGWPRKGRLHKRVHIRYWKVQVYCERGSKKEHETSIVKLFMIPMFHMTMRPVPSLLLWTLNLQLSKLNCKRQTQNTT